MSTTPVGTNPPAATTTLNVNELPSNAQATIALMNQNAQVGAAMSMASLQGHQLKDPVKRAEDNTKDMLS